MRNSIASAAIAVAIMMAGPAAQAFTLPSPAAAQEDTAQNVVRVAGGFLRIQRQLLARLRAQPGRPLDRALAPRFYARFAAYNRREGARLADLRAHPGAAQGRAWISLSARVGATLRVFTLRLRLFDCSAYFAGA